MTPCAKLADSGLSTVGPLHSNVVRRQKCALLVSCSQPDG
jgi:hypothetical protein